jgi:hypothetical protein
MSEIKVNNIQSLGGTNGPVISGTVEMNSTGAMSLPRGDTAYRGSRGTGIFAGGRTSPGLKERMDKFTISTLGNGLDFGNLTTVTSEFGGCASSTRGIFMGGEQFPSNINVIQYLTISQLGNTFDFGDLTLTRRATICLSDNTRGICVGGNNAPGGVGFTLLDYVTIATTGNATKFGDTSAIANYAYAHASTTRGIIGLGGSPYASPYPGVNTIEYITISTEGNAKDFGDLTDTRKEGSSASNSTRGLFFGGQNPSLSPSVTNIIDYITIASLGDAIDFGDCIAGSALSSACSSPTRAIFGDMSSDANTISYVTINTLGNAQDFGDLDLARNQTAACSDSHGGLE